MTNNDLLFPDPLPDSRLLELFLRLWLWLDRR